MVINFTHLSFPGSRRLITSLRSNPMSFNTLAGIGEYSRLKQIFAGEQPFVVNAHGKGDAKLALKAAQTTGVPCRIMSRHNGVQVKNTWPNKKIYKTRCHYVFTTSNDTTAHLKQTFSLSDMQIFSIPDGITVPDAAPNNTTKKAIRQKLANILGLKTDARFIDCTKIKSDEKISLDEEILNIIFTPGHTDDSYSLLLPDRVFSGDTLLIRGTGRTDFQNGPKEVFWFYPKSSYYSCVACVFASNFLVHAAYDKPYNQRLCST